MNAQQVILDSRLVHVRELRGEVARLKAENLALRTANDELSHHLDLALTAAEDLRTLPEGGRLQVWDGWNLVLGADKAAENPEALAALARKRLEENPFDRIWIVFDGPRENSRSDGRLRISYTGGNGQHRADKFICAFLRMARFRGDLSRIDVWTKDKDFARDVRRLKS